MRRVGVLISDVSDRVAAAGTETFGRVSERTRPIGAFVLNVEMH
jgi:hypothetical protein